MTQKRWRARLLLGAAAVVAAGVLAAAAAAASPANTGAPTISGTARQGSTLTANNGTWSNNPASFSYQWQRCAADGTGCANISGATSGTYRLAPADVDHTVRVAVTASNSDGQATAYSSVSALVSANSQPNNTVKPTISGTPVPGNDLTANPGTWTGGVHSFSYQWQSCDSSGANCTTIAGATGKTYGIRAADTGHTLRVLVTGANLAGSTSATSDPTGLVRTATPPPPAPTVNKPPTIRILSTRFVGARIYARMRVCDDSRKNLTIIERDSKPGVASYTRRFGTLTPPAPCAALTRNWLPAPRFRHGRYTVTVWARDKSGKTSLPARRTFFR
jgi:hypothetical protein